MQETHNVMHSPFGAWINEDEHPPTVGQWAVVLCDTEMAGDGSFFYKHFKMPRFSIKVGLCVGFDEEGYADWWESRDGKNPIAYCRIAHVTHYMPMPELLPPEDAPLPKWVLENQPWRAE